ncbi:MAG TPA: HAMP domain-containing histidine kinase [Bacteroidetes bacterium]|nr:HAMP domain-containing histidine kinase [Bacteroidota bacterium]
MSMERNINFPLFWKFSSIAVFVVLIFGTINIYLLWSSVYRSFEKEIDKRCIVLSSIIAEKVVSPIVYENIVSIYSELEEAQKSDKSIAYIFILDKFGNIIARTTDIKIPPQLISANSIGLGSYQIKIIEAKNFSKKIIRDIAYPILNGQLGSVRLGIVEEDIRTELNESTKKLLLMILLFLIIGLAGALFFSFLITSPIKAISKKAHNVNLDTITKENLKIERPRYKKILNFYFKDELDLLVSKFNMMLARLKRNVEELKRNRDSFIQTEKLASIGTLTSGIGHEINNPLSGIQNGVNRLIRNPDDIEQNKKYLDLIKEATDKIEIIVQQLLNFSRKQDVLFERINPVTILENSIKLVSYKLNKYNIIVKQSLCCVQYLNASTNHLEQVFLNLFLNSIDAINEKRKMNPDFQGKISIRLECKEGKSIIHINDNGIGIKDEIQNSIFDPFFTTKEVGKGTGLGLYVSYDIIKEHGGKLSFNSTYGTGTEFIIILPIIDTEELNENDIKNNEFFDLDTL